MKGMGALLRKELLEQRRTWRFIAMVIVFTLVAVMAPAITRIVVAATGGRVPPAQDLLQGVVGGAIPGIGTFVAIIVAMGALAGERASGTAAMTLSKPVTRSAFVLAKFLSIALGIMAAVAFASLIAYLFTLALFGDAGFGRFVLGVLVIGVYLVFIGAVSLFWSAIFARPLLVGGIAYATILLMQPLMIIPHAFRYIPVAAALYGGSIIGGRTANVWPAFAIVCGLIVLLPAAAWVVFRRKEL